MQRINTPDGNWQAGDPSQGIKGTVVTRPFMQAVQEELAAIPEAIGLVLDPNNNTQVLAALRLLFAKLNGDSTQLFSIARATQAQHALRSDQALGLYLGAQVFSASGTYMPGTYILAGRIVTASKARFRLVGGGGGGGGCGATNASQSAAACGGNGGEYKEFIVPSGLSSQTITIGAGGAGGAAGFNFGSQGGTTSIGSLVSVVGGLGGSAGGAGAPPYINTGQANNGGGTPSGNTIVWRGCSLGGAGLASSLAYVLGGQGGDSPFGAGGKGGSAPSSPGAGGGGGAVGAGATAIGGAAGSNGLVLVEEYA
ncbi:glycine-rich domain-containing protein [Burkholderia sp. BDU5]|uniref:glycine-rich domain-containing protein n=1 Tax=Burkholderia sp. BDU5 TaxID=1385590 RepID=UPI000A6B7AEF|nr:hypothetical protein [Burkholderia sp. BDU5]